MYARSPSRTFYILYATEIPNRSDPCSRLTYSVGCATETLRVREGESVRAPIHSGRGAAKRQQKSILFLEIVFAEVTSLFLDILFSEFTLFFFSFLFVHLVGAPLTRMELASAPNTERKKDRKNQKVCGDWKTFV